MEFFLPFAESKEQSESMYTTIADFVKAKLPDSTERIHQITYTQNGIKMTATVGDNCDDYYQIDSPKVIAIFESNPFKICLKDHGVTKDNPIYVNANDVISISYFDE